MVDHSHNTKVVGVIRKAELSLVKRGLQLQRNIVFRVRQQQELRGKEKVQQKHEYQEQTDDPPVEPALLFTTELSGDPPVAHFFLLLVEAF